MSLGVEELDKKWREMMPEHEKEHYAKVMALLEEQHLSSPFVKLANELGDLVTAKNSAYGDSAQVTGEIMTLLFPNGIPVGRMKHALLLVRVLDKVVRESTSHDVENWKDLAGYGLLGWHHG